MNAKYLITLVAVVVSVSLSACGGGGGEGSPASDGSDRAAGTGDNGVPAEARVDGQSFIAWLQTLLIDTNSQGEPVKVESGGSLVDESAEPRVL